MVQGFAGYHAALQSRERHCRMPSEIIRLSHDTLRRPPLEARRPDGIRGCLHASQRCQLRVHWDIALILIFIFSVGAYQSRCDNGDVPSPSNCQLQFPIPILPAYDLFGMCFCSARFYLFMICLTFVFVVQLVAGKSRDPRPDKHLANCQP